nr:ABC transporter ATP-binding protein [Lachnoclostridium phocaeense]
MIEVRNLVKYYGDHMAVDHLNFTIQKGQIYGFLGPNGAGKSTTMNIMTGYLGATEGQILINGHDILAEPYKAKRDIGYLPEQPPLYMDMTVLEYLKFVAALKLIDKSIKSAQLDQVISLVRLEPVKNRLIKNLSKGYRQRVGLAGALIGFPEIIILDEPTVGLDPQQIIEIRQLIRGLAKDHTVILSSHILSEVREVCDHIMIIYQGKLVASDTPENLEQKMQGNETIELLVKGSPEQTGSVIRQLPSILSSQIEDSGETGCTKALLTVKEQNDIREDIFWTFCKNELPLLRLANTRTTLEDIFLELTSSESSRNNDITKEDPTDESNL